MKQLTADDINLKDQSQENADLQISSDHKRDPENTDQDEQEIVYNNNMDLLIQQTEPGINIADDPTMKLPSVINVMKRKQMKKRLKFRKNQVF